MVDLTLDASAASSAFARLLATGDEASRSRDRPERIVGLEHEYIVRNGDEVIDFRGLIHRLEVDGRRLDPFDPYAYRCTWGGILTADEAEAEVAIAPVTARRGFADAVDHRAGQARAALEALLPKGHGLEGYSTHLSIAHGGPYQPAVSDAICRAYAAHFGAALMLLADRSTSPGLLLMSRPGRTELGVEFIDGPWLRAAMAFALGSVLAIENTLGATSARTANADLRARVAAALGRMPRLPPALALDLIPAVRRYGWFAGRGAFGSDLLRGGRATQLRRATGGTITAGEHLVAAWEVARRVLESFASPADVADTDAVVSGRTALPLELSAGHGAVSSPGGLTTTTDVAVDTTSNPFGAMVRRRRRPGFIVEPAVATWDFVVFRVRAGRGGYACVPRPELAPYLDRLDAGDLDESIAAFLAEPARGRLLTGWHEARRPGLYDAIGPLRDFAPPERDSNGDPWMAGGGGHPSRPGKTPSTTTTTPPPVEPPKTTTTTTPPVEPPMVSIPVVPPQSTAPPVQPIRLEPPAGPTEAPPDDVKPKGPPEPRMEDYVTPGDGSVPPPPVPPPPVPTPVTQPEPPPIPRADLPPMDLQSLDGLPPDVALTAEDADSPSYGGTTTTTPETRPDAAPPEPVVPPPVTPPSPIATPGSGIGGPVAPLPDDFGAPGFLSFGAARNFFENAGCTSILLLLLVLVIGAGAGAYVLGAFGSPAASPSSTPSTAVPSATTPSAPSPSSAPASESVPSESIPSESVPSLAVLIKDNVLVDNVGSPCFAPTTMKEHWVVTGVPAGSAVVVDMTGPGLPAETTFVVGGDGGFGKDYTVPKGPGIWTTHIVSIAGAPAPARNRDNKADNTCG